MSQMHRSNEFRRGSLFQKSVNRFLVKSGFEEILQFREYPVNVSSELDLKPGPLFDVLLPETAEILQVHEVDILLRKEPVRLSN